MAFHWLTVLLVAGQWLGAHMIDWFPRGAARVDARSLHITLGALLGELIVARLVWRLTGGRRLSPADRGALRALASSVHGLLYALLASTIALGLLNAGVRGDSLFGLVSLPKLAAPPSLREQAQHWHGLSANLLLALAGFHASAGLWHRYGWRDGVLARMIPVLRPPSR